MTQDRDADPAGIEWQSCWLLEPDKIFLNHGSFGACPRPVLALQQRLRERLERRPLDFLVRELEGLLDRSREALAAFVGAEAQDIAFVPNVTMGVNAILRSLQFHPGDELLLTNHAYTAIRNSLHFIAQQTGAKLVIAEIPFPLSSPLLRREAVLAAVSPRTRLVLLDHVTSQTGLIFPLESLIGDLNALGIDTLVDGAHAPGMLPLQLSTLSPTYYIGSCHKWLCAPKGSAFLFVQRQRQPAIRPLAISSTATPRFLAGDRNAGRSRFWLEFDWMGTDDPTAYLCVPEAIRWLGSQLPGGWTELREHNHTTAVMARQLLCEALQIPLPCPDEVIGSMAAVPLPADPPDGSDALQGLSLQDLLWQQFSIEAKIVPWPQPPGRLLRVSAQLYNQRQDYEQLAAALMQILQCS